MGKFWNGSCGLVIAGRSIASAAQLHQFTSYHGAADLALALGAEWVHFQEYLIKSQLHEHLRRESTELAPMKLIRTHSNKHLQSHHRRLLYWNPFPEAALFIKEIRTWKMWYQCSGPDLQLTLLPCFLWGFVLLYWRQRRDVPGQNVANTFIE